MSELLSLTTTTVKSMPKTTRRPPKECSLCNNATIKNELYRCGHCREYVCEGPDPTKKCVKTRSPYILCFTCYENHWGFCSSCGLNKLKTQMVFCSVCQVRGFCVGSEASCLDPPVQLPLTCSHCDQNTTVNICHFFLSSETQSCF